MSVVKSSLCAVVMSLIAAPVARAEVVTIREDRGGPVVTYIDHVAQLSKSGAEVRIEGLCLSACTLYLGAKNICIGEEAKLGFHGPASAFGGFPLPKPEFERLTKQMARHYPKPLRDWFMSTARYELTDYYVVTGAEAIRMGVKRCA